MSNISAWQLQIPMDAIVFDCDGTLSHIEGIDELASMKGVGDAVKNLTAIAMGQSGINPAIFQQRLNLVKPSYEQVIALGDAYIAQQSPGVKTVIRILQQLDKAVYIVSAGLLPAVAAFGNYLGIRETEIYAVGIDFHANGGYRDFDQHSPLVTANGKRTIVEQLKAKHKHIVHIGDGLNDLSTFDIVTRFIGYGGAFYRENIAKLCHYYLRSPAMSTLLPLCLTAHERTLLSTPDQEIYHLGLMQLQHELHFA